MISKSIRYALFSHITLFSLTIGITFPTLWKLLKDINVDSSFLAYVVAIFSIGEFLGSFFLSRLYQYFGERMSFIINLIIAIIGNIIFSHSILINNTNAKWMILVGRLFLGFYSGGSQTIEQIFISNNMKEDDNKLEYIIKLGIFLRFGFIIGPFIGIFLTYIDFDAGYINIIPETGANYILIILEIFQILIFIYSFRRYKCDDVLILELSLTEINEISMDDIILDIENSINELKEERESGEIPFNIPGVIICLMSLFISYLVFSFQETVVIAAVDKYYNWGPTEISYLFTYSGVLNAILSYGLIQYGRRNEVNNIFILGLSCLIGCIGFIIMFQYTKSYNMWKFLIGFTFMTIQSSFSRPYIFTVYAKYIDPEKLTKYFGYLFMSASLSRIIGAYLFVFLYFQTIFNSTFIVFFVLFTLNFFGFLLLRKKLSV